MAKHRATPRQSSLPSADDILEFIAQNPGKSGKREIARAFKVPAAQRVALKGLLRDMAERGLVTKRGKRLDKAGELPPVMLLFVRGRDDDGELVGEPTDWDEEEQGPPPQITVLPVKKPGKDNRQPGIGDRVLARIARRDDALGYEARPIKVLGSQRARALGVLRKTERGNWRVSPIDKKARSDFAVASEDLNDATEGDLVEIEPMRSRALGLPRAKVVEQLANVRSEKTVSLIAIHNHRIPHVFPSKVLEAAKASTEADMTNRTDLRDLPFVTIDPADAKDHDDAVYAEPDPDNPDGFIVWVAIADVSWFVRPGSALDREAVERGNSVYFPDRVVPMLPERISNDLCSLKEGVDRAALVVRMVFDKSGRKKGHKFLRGMIKSVMRLSYQEAQTAFDGKPDERVSPIADTVLKPLLDAYGTLAKARDDREPLALDLPERKLVLKPDGTVDHVMIPDRLDAHRLIEEFMIQANVAAAEALEDRRSPLVYRVHDAPGVEKMNALSEVVSSLGLSLAKPGQVRPFHFNRLLAQAEELPNRELVNTMVLRTQSQAEYSPENYGHFGLNLRRYAHFTSPIRRYADLIVHRALVSAYKLGEGGLDPSDLPKLAEIASQISGTERRAMAAERETVDRLITGYLSEKIGTQFRARITGVTRAGLFLELTETGADGFLPLRSLDYDYFHVDQERHAIIGERTSEAFQLGDTVEVKLEEAAPLAGALRFSMVSDGKSLGQPRASRFGRPKKPRGFGKSVAKGRRRPDKPRKAYSGRGR
ncbi:MAG: ribonuclease R [Pseudomonadota bacterium]